MNYIKITRPSQVYLLLSVFSIHYNSLGRLRHFQVMQINTKYLGGNVTFYNVAINLARIWLFCLPEVCQAGRNML
jgi:hypothetical protein